MKTNIFFKKKNNKKEYKKVKKLFLKIKKGKIIYT